MQEKRGTSGRISGFLRANALGLVAIFIALCGTATALPHTSIHSRDIANGSIRSVDLAPNSVTSPKVAPDTLTGFDIKEESLQLDDLIDSSFYGDDPTDPEDPGEEIDPETGLPYERVACKTTGTDATGAVLMRCTPTAR